MATVHISSDTYDDAAVLRDVVQGALRLRFNDAARTDFVVTVPHDDYRDNATGQYTTAAEAAADPDGTTHENADG